MATTMCPAHLTRKSIATCRRCARPICDECMAQFGGRFCSPECAEKFEDFQSRVIDEPVVRRRRFSLVGCLRTMALSVVLLAIIWVALWQLFGTTDLTEMWSELGKMLRLLF